MAWNKISTNNRHENTKSLNPKITSYLIKGLFMRITIENASPQHLNTIWEIEKKCFEAEAFTKQQIVQLLTDPNSICLVAKLDRQIVGFIIGTIYRERKALSGHILTIDVLPTHRRKGIGLRLLQEIEKIFKEKNIKTCCLEVREDNTAALKLYKKLGYVQVGKLKMYYLNANGIYLRKVLT